METTLKMILAKDENFGKSILEIKKKLQGYKKEGIIFFTEDIFSLQEDEPFQLYFSYKSSSKSLKNCFPIPLNDYLQTRKENRNLEALYEFYYQDYYKEPIEKQRIKKGVEIYRASDIIWAVI